MIRLLPLLMVWAQANAATLTAADCSVASVNVAITASANGDTVIIPNGSCTWASGIATAKQITLQGASVGGVTITHAAGAGDLLTLTIGTTARTQIANLRFIPGTATGNYLTVQGSGLAPLMHDMYFNLPNFQLQHAVQWFVTGGVIWNTVFESTDNLLGACGTKVGSDSGSIVVKSNLDSDAASTMGLLDTTGESVLYIEDTVFSNVGQSPDVDDRGRVALRHIQCIGCSGLTHGTTSTYGGREVQIYDSVFSYPNQNRNQGRYFWFRAGTAVITGNAIQPITGQCYGTHQAEFTFAAEGAARSGQHGCCTGYMCFHQPGSGADGTGGHAAVLGPAQIPNTGFQVSDPVYVWGNTGAANIALNDGDPRDCTAINPATGAPYTTGDFFKPNRDYFLTAKPGWSRYPYPHPLRTGLVIPPVVPPVVVPPAGVAAGALTGTTLAPNVTGSSLTSGAGGPFGTSAYTAALPIQAGHAGQFLQTDGARASWAVVNTHSLLADPILTQINVLQAQVKALTARVVKMEKAAK